MIDGYRVRVSRRGLLAILEAIINDHTINVPVLELAERKSASGRSPVFVYLFAQTDSFDGVERAPHAAELPFVFHRPDLVTPSARDLVGMVSDAWIAFAHRGEPNHAAIPTWPPYAVPERTTMVFDVQSRVESNGHRAVEN